jgi:hypothetical protein
MPFLPALCNFQDTPREPSLTAHPLHPYIYKTKRRRKHEDRTPNTYPKQNAGCMPRHRDSVPGAPPNEAGQSPPDGDCPPEAAQACRDMAPSDTTVTCRFRYCRQARRRPQEQLEPRDMFFFSFCLFPLSHPSLLPRAAACRGALSSTRLAFSSLVFSRWSPRGPDERA